MEIDVGIALFHLMPALHDKIEIEIIVVHLSEIMAAGHSGHIEASPIIVIPGIIIPAIISLNLASSIIPNLDLPDLDLISPATPVRTIVNQVTTTMRNGKEK